jgi:hypothetical protein
VGLLVVRMVSRSRNSRRNQDRGMEGCGWIALWEQEKRVKGQHCGFGVCCQVERRRRSKFVGGDRSCFQLLGEAVGVLFLGVFPCVSRRSVCGGRIFVEFREEQLLGWALEVVVVRGQACMFVVLV